MTDKKKFTPSGYYQSLKYKLYKIMGCLNIIKHQRTLLYFNNLTIEILYYNIVFSLQSNTQYRRRKSFYLYANLIRISRTNNIYY